MSSEIGSVRLGFGCANLPARSEALLETALDAGIAHFDTARMYDHGAAEGALGAVAQRRRGEMIIVSKAGIAPPGLAGRALKRALGAIPALAAAGEPRFGQFTHAQVMRSVETSLRELKTDYLDALLLHEVAPADITDELKRTLEELVRQGKARRTGIATSAQSTKALLDAHPDLCGIVQVAANEAGAPLPGLAIIHSVLGARLNGFMARLAGDSGLAQRFRDATGIDRGDKDAIATLLLTQEMARRPDSVILFSSRSPAQIARNASLLSQAPNLTPHAGFARFLETTPGFSGA